MGLERNSDEEIRMYEHVNCCICDKDNTKFLLSCSSSEGLNMTILEAFACGALPIVSDLPVHREIMRGHGIIFNSPSEAIEYIHFFLTNEEERREICRRNREFVEKEYTWKKITDKFLIGLKKCL